MDYSKPEYHQTRHGILCERTETYISKIRLSKITKQLNLKGKEKILEVGVGYGWNLKFFPNKVDGHDLINVLTNKNVVFKKKGELKTNSYDIILCHHVLEHIELPIKFIKENLNFLKKDGKMIFYLPIEKKSAWLPSNSDLDNHLYSWTPRTFSNLINESIKDCKIEIIGYRRFGFDRIFGSLSKVIGYRASKLLHRLALFVSPRYEIFCIIRKIND